MKKNVYMYNGVTLLYKRNEHNVVNQLYFSEKERSEEEGRKEGEKRKEETERKGRLEGASQCPSSYRKPASQEASFTGSLGALEAPVVGSWEPLGWRGCVGPC